jgi:hypothetical protein
MFLLRNHGAEHHDTKSSTCPHIWRSADHGLKTLSSRVKWKGGGVQGALTAMHDGNDRSLNAVAPAINQARHYKQYFSKTTPRY